MMRCAVCGEEILGEQVLACSSCVAPHHFDCWAYAGRCARYACRCREAIPRTFMALASPPRTALAAPAGEGHGLVAGDWVHGWELRTPERLARRVSLMLAALLALLRG